MAPARGVIVLGTTNIPTQHATYRVNATFDYYLQLNAGCSVTFESLDGRPISINRHIWGPGNIIMNCDVNVNAPMGQAPAQKLVSSMKAIFESLESVTFERI
ncbi:hypothetical protein CYMTET_49991 [Cymbomonas tetramitiformis]|uniref:Uncharacterized protein n=1 Tax=Cymbomonas tetramitiformis TaxID=36881 RepID=A0AAE0BQE1_9CHLO|nr:hypothetical protein CYMTET_49991 [Cymbomonas tetramitiformis]